MKPSQVQNLIENIDSFQSTFLGTRTSTLGVEENVGIPDNKRLIHVLNTGPTGYGKTQLMIHAALQDAHKDHGFCMVIPKGDAINQVLAKLPEERLNDVLYLNPAQENIPSINVLEPYVTEDMTRQQKENQKEIIVSDLIDLFKRQSQNWGDQFGRVLETLLRAHIDLNIQQQETNSLLDVFRCVIQDDAVTELIDRTEDTVVREQLVRVKEDMSSYQMEPLQRRLNDFVMNSTIRSIVSSTESDIDFRQALNKKKIILVEVQKGELGDTVSQLLGSIVITKVWAAAQSRITEKPENRTPFFLYVDELQNFGSEGSALAKMLSEAREYRLGCWLATQYLSNLDSSKMQGAVLNNCRTKIVFKPSDSEQQNRLISSLNQVSKKQVNQLGRFRAVLQTPDEQQQTPAVIFDTYPPWTNEEQTDIEKLKKKHSVATPRNQQTTGVQLNQSLGQANNAGGKTHEQLLLTAKQKLENEKEGTQVNLLYQDPGDNKPDGKIILPDGSIAHLEAEHSTLSKPVKVLTNYQRATQQDRECIFIVQQGNAKKLENILTDPVNRRGQEHEDNHGTYSYYQTENDQFTDTESLKNGEYRIIEARENQIEIHNESVEAECPELNNHPENELKNFCLYREDDGHCTKLGQPCVLTQADD